MEDQRDNSGGLKTRAQEIHESPTTNLFSLERSYATVDDFEDLENSFHIPGGPLTVCWNFGRGTLIRLVFPNSVEISSVFHAEFTMIF